MDICFIFQPFEDRSLVWIRLGPGRIAGHAGNRLLLGQREGYRFCVGRVSLASLTAVR